MSIRVFKYRYDADIAPNQFRDVSAALNAAGHRPLIAAINNSYFEILQIDPADLPTAEAPSFPATFYQDGDFFASQDWSEIVYVARTEESRFGSFLRSLATSRKRKHYLECGAITFGRESDLLKAIQEIALKALAPRSNSSGFLVSSDSHPSWSPIPWSNEKFDKLHSSAQTEKPRFTPDDLDASNLLSERRLRSLVLEVKRVGQKGLPLATLNNGDVETLKSVGLLEAKQGTIMSTERAKALLDHSRWMSVLLVQKLTSMGVPEARINLEYQETGEEVDALVDIDGKLLMVELKDKEFSRGHAHALSERTRMYKPSHVLVVSGEKVSSDVRNHFEQYKLDARMSYADGIDHLDTALEAVANEIRKLNLADLLEHFGPLIFHQRFSELLMLRLGLTPEMKISKMAFAKELARTVYGEGSHV